MGQWMAGAGYAAAAAVPARGQEVAALTWVQWGGVRSTQVILGLGQNPKLGLTSPLWLGFLLLALGQVALNWQRVTATPWEDPALQPSGRSPVQPAGAPAASLC